MTLPAHLTKLLVLFLCFLALPCITIDAASLYELRRPDEQFGGLQEATDLNNAGQLLVNESTSAGYTAYAFDAVAQSVQHYISGYDFTYGRGIAPDGTAVGGYDSISNQLPGQFSFTSAPTPLATPGPGGSPEGTDGTSTVGWYYDFGLGQARAITFGGGAQTLVNSHSRAYDVDGNDVAGAVGNLPARIDLDTGNYIASSETTYGEFRDVQDGLFVGYGVGPLGWTWAMVAEGSDPAYFLPTLPAGNGVYATARGTNGSVIVGQAAGQSNNVGVVWLPGGSGYEIHELNDLFINDQDFPVHIRDAVAVNSDGWIGVNGVDYFGRPFAGVLVPVPEPGAFLLFTTGSLFLAVGRLIRYRQTLAVSDHRDTIVRK